MWYLKQHSLRTLPHVYVKEKMPLIIHEVSVKPAVCNYVTLTVYKEEQK